jgi:hypothetical protein
MWNVGTQRFHARNMSDEMYTYSDFYQKYILRIDIFTANYLGNLWPLSTNMSEKTFFFSLLSLSMEQKQAYRITMLHVCICASISTLNQFTASRKIWPERYATYHTLKFSMKLAAWSRYTHIALLGVPMFLRHISAPNTCSHIQDYTAP